MITQYDGLTTEHRRTDFYLYSFVVKSISFFVYLYFLCRNV